MAATFNPALTSNRDRVRQKIGDTDVTRADFQDETIDTYLADYATVLWASYHLALDLAAKWTKKSAKVTIDDQQQDSTKIAQGYRDLAAQIKCEIDAAVPVDGTGAPSGILVMGIGDCRGPLQNRPRYDYDCEWGC